MLSNHLPMVIKKISAMIEERIFTISCNETEFSISLPIYNQAFWKSRYKIDFLTHISLTRNLAATVNETLLGSNPHLTIKFSPTLIKRFSTTCKNISHPSIRYTTAARKIIPNLAIVGHLTRETS